MGEKKKKKLTLEGLLKFAKVGQSSCKYIYIYIYIHTQQINNFFIFNTNWVAIELFSQLLDWGERESDLKGV